VTVAFIQFAPEYLAADANRARINGLLEDADADLIVLPELCSSGYFFHSAEHLASVAEPVPDGPTTQLLQHHADAKGATIVAGLPERDGEAFYNSAVVVSPDGPPTTYRKVHLFYQETTLFTPGDGGFPVAACTARDGTDYRLGVMVCFDWYFPESARTLALQGADIIAHPSNLVLPHCPDAMPIRARENHVFTVTANRHGTEHHAGETLTFIGMSEVCAPTGDILVRAPEASDAIETVAIDPAEARDKSINAYNDVLGDRRPTTYRQASSAQPAPEAS
jgi:predicted amidohydrolase